MPQAAVIDDKYGLEQAPVPTGVTDDKYGLEPAQKQSDSGVEPNLPGATPRLVAAAKTNPKVAEMIKPSRFEEEHSPEPENVGTWNRIKQYGRGVGNIVSGMADMAAQGLAGGPSPKEIAEHASSIALADQERKAQGRSTPYRMLATGASMAGVDPTGMERAAEHGDPVGVGVEAGVQATPVAAGEIGRIPAVERGIGKAAEFAGDKVSNAKDAVALNLRKPDNTLRPGVKAASKLVGAAAGHTLGIPGLGELGGYFVGPTVAESIIPNRPFETPTKVNPGAPLPDASEFYGEKGEDLVRRGKEQEALDRKAPKESPIGSIKLPPQLQGTSTLSDSAGAAPSTGPQVVKPMVPPQQPFPLVKTRAQVAAEAEAAKPKIVTKDLEKPYRPETGPNIESEGRGATWTDDTVLDLAQEGNRAAIAQVGARQLQKKFAGDPRLANIRYIAGDIDYRNLITSPREVTKFAPDGTVIRQEVPNPQGRNMDSVARAGRTPRIVQAVEKQGEIPKVAAGGSSATLNFDRSIKVPSEGPVLLKPEAPAPEQATPAPKEGYQGPERRSEPRTDTGERSWGFYKRMLREGGPEEQALAREALKRMETPAPAGVAPMDKPTNLLPGMAEHVEKQAEGAARVKGEDLTAQIRQPRDINAAAGEMETKSPLFRGTNASPQRELLQPMEKPVETAPEREPGDEPEEEATPTEIKGVTQPVKAKAAPKPKPLPIEKRFSKEQIDDAEGLIKQEIGMLQSADRPGIYYDQNEIGDFNPQKIQSSARGVTSGGNWRGLKSGREMQPWLKGTKFTPAQLEKALRNKDSAVYQRAMESAMEFIRRQNMTPEERAMAAAAEAEKWKNLVPPKSKFADLSKK